MLEQGKHQNLGGKSIIQEHKLQKAIASASMQGHGKGTFVEAKSLVKHGKGVRAIFSSDAERKLDGVRYRLGDMVWAKVKSHPWWPGQLYDPALATNATECKRDSYFLVAFFGDSTYNWFPEAELIPYEPNFVQKSRQTSLPSFVDAVEDSLDEVRRRVKTALTCHCSMSEEASDSGGKKDGLLYDRQSRDIRRNFEPAKLLSTIKQLARSPFSFSQNRLRSTVAGAQTDAFRLLVSSKGTEGLGESSQSNRLKAHDPDAVRSAEVLKDKTMPEKNASMKHQPKTSLISNSCQDQADGMRKQTSNEKLRGTVDVGKAKQYTTGVISKKKNREKSKDSCGVKGIIKGTVLEKKSIQPLEYGVQDKQATSASAGKEILASKASHTKKIGIEEIGQSPEQSESFVANVLSNKGIPCLVGRDSLTTSQNKAQQRKLKKSAGPAVKAISTVVPEAEAMELVVPGKEPSTALKKAKVAKVDDGQFLKLKTTKKFVGADVESSGARKKVKALTEGKSKVSKQPKRVLEDEPKQGLDVLSREMKKRKLLPDFRGKDSSDYTLGDYTGNSIASDALPTSDLPQQVDDVISDPMGLESEVVQCVESLMHVETRDILPTEPLDMVLEVGQLHQEDVLQDKHADDASTEAQDVGAGFLVQQKESDADHKSVGRFQAQITSSINKEKEDKVKDSNLVEHREVSTFRAGAVMNKSKKKEKKSQDMETIEVLKPEGLSHHDNDVNVTEEGGSLITLSKVSEDQTLKNLDSLPTEADPCLAHFHGTSPGRSLACNAVENMQDVRQTNKEVSSVKYGQESEPLNGTMESNHLPPSNNVLSSKKRVVEECPSKSSKAKSKWIRTLSVENAVKCHADFVAKDGEEHEMLNKRDEVTSLQNLHEGLMSVAAKPLNANEEEFCSAVRRAFKNFRKVVYKKAVHHTGPENAVTFSAAAASEEVSVIGNEIDKMAELEKEPAEVKAMSSDVSTDAEPSKAENVRTQEGGDVLINQRQSKEDSTTSQSRPTKRSITISKTPSSSSISLRPAFEAKIPVRGSKEVLNRFGQRVPQLSDAGERLASPPSRVKSYFEERALVISFHHEFVLPSEKQLREVFGKFGHLNSPLTRVDSKNSCAHVVFRRTQDAEAALRSMKETPVFENARFCLKPRDADRKGTAKVGSRNTAFSDRPTLTSGKKPEAKIASDKVRIKTASDGGLLVCPSNDTDSITVGDRLGVTQNCSSRITEVGGKEGSLQSSYGVKNVPSSLIADASQKAQVGAIDPSKGNPVESYPTLAASSLVLHNAGPRSLAPPVVTDISEPFLALLHQLHDLVVSTGFVM